MSFPDFSQELAVLLQHVAGTAMAIRVQNLQATSSEAIEAQYDLAWIADLLHNFDALGRAVAKKDLNGVISACDRLQCTYERYSAGNPDAKAISDRLYENHAIMLSPVIKSLRKIRTKTSDFGQSLNG